MLINSINLQRLRNSEFLQFLKNLLQIIQLNDPVALQVDAIYRATQAVTAEIDALFKTERGTATTAQIEALDLRRDLAINGLLAVINGYTYHFDPAISGAAEKLQFNLKNYGAGIARENYQSETAILGSILGDWANKPLLAAAITQLKLTDWMTELSTANEDFNTLYISRTQEFAAVSPDTILAKRLEAMTQYYSLRDTLNAWYTIRNGAAPYDKVTNECNALIDQYNALISTGTGSTPADPIDPVDPIDPILPADPAPLG